ncbi:MAG TPA: hypothetical protein VF276_08160 [Chloroflexia bacterium]
MDPEDTDSHSFIIRIWLEETAEEGQPAVWRGHITHVPSGRRRYLQEFDALVSFIAPYLEEMRMPVDGGDRRETGGVDTSQPRAPRAGVHKRLMAMMVHIMRRLQG